MIVSTAARTNDKLNERAQSAAEQLQAPFVLRKKRSIAALQKAYNTGCLIVGKDRLEYYPFGSAEPFFFHPNSASFRVKRLMRGEVDPFIEAAGLERGMTLLDCTLGLASDSIAASCVVGQEGKVIGIEGNPVLAYIVEQGLKEWESPVAEMNEAMARISIRQGNYRDILPGLSDQSADVVYFDPMFTKAISASEGIAPLRHLAVYEELNETAIKEALRIARRRVVLKDHYQSPRFKRFGFKQQIRPASLFHFGIIEVK
ncbi:class I SAM-dependent methyltransferase [Bacillus thermotolerans]|uniref:class I SAM-dependent methyltransferase n=1 Tax=Bacillus thermotolerans TaxID=1221996 RepID=UPI00057DDA14|nr:class I SAM-dependent methyltransferase [Bacillus thermotolerans]KKB38523.1 Protein-L-isoD(D-D) O-methyltransferase [Bacillus thermotolerans]